MDICTRMIAQGLDVPDGIKNNDGTILKFSEQSIGMIKKKNTYCEEQFV